MFECDIEKSIYSDNALESLKKDVVKELQKMNARMLVQGGKINEIVNHVKDHLVDGIGDMFRGLKESGELDSIISSVLSDLDNSIVYYGSEIYTEKFRDSVSGSDCYLTHIPPKDQKGNRIEMRVGIANDDTTMKGVESTIDFANRKNATLCINAGFFDIDTEVAHGVVIRDGRILKNDVPNSRYGYIAFDESGNIKYFPYTTDANTMIRQGMKQALCCGVRLIENHEPVIQSDTTTVEPRQVIAQMFDGTILILTVDGRSRESKGMTYPDLIRVLLPLGVRCAYNLDGGGSTSTVLRGVKQNENIDYAYVDRKVVNFLYVAKPVAEDEKQIMNESFKEVGRVKQDLIKKIVNLLDFEKGYIRIRGGENYYGTGIEFYVNAEDTRRSKLGINFDKTNPRNRYMYLSLRAEESEKSNLFRIYDHGVWVQCYHGTSSERPNAVVGVCYFDETIGKPIWYTGSKWVDANGETV